MLRGGHWSSGDDAVRLTFLRPYMTAPAISRWRQLSSAVVKTLTRHSRAASDDQAVFFLADRNSSILRSHFISWANAKASSGFMKTVSFSAG